MIATSPPLQKGSPRAGAAEYVLRGMFIHIVGAIGKSPSQNKTFFLDSLIYYLIIILVRTFFISFIKVNKRPIHYTVTTISRIVPCKIPITKIFRARAVKILYRLENHLHS